MSIFVKLSINVLSIYILPNCDTHTLNNTLFKNKNNFENSEKLLLKEEIVILWNDSSVKLA